MDALSPPAFEALRWSVRMADGLSPMARTEFQAWLGAKPEHREAFEDMARVWDAIDDLPPAGAARLRTTVAIEKASESSALGAIGDAHPPVPAPAAERARTSRRLLPHALVATLAAGLLGGGWFGWDIWQNQPIFNRHYATQRGQSLDAALPDGSQLVFDTATQADVTLYRNRREVSLPEGQAVFKVQADKSRPFHVLAGAARITVVGTKFSVRYTPSIGSKAVQVAVMEGKVRVSGASGEGHGQTVELSPGQAVNVDNQGRPGRVDSVPPDAMAPWRGRRLSFDNTPLANVLAELGRYGESGLRVSDPAIGGLPVTASVDLDHIDGFTRSLPLVLPVRLRQHDGARDIVAR
ncbi:hypothetical protein A9975_12205 [Cupriavidus sp. UME77]|nr:hypothetical protein [Cupriavidus sp. UME77]